MEFLVKPIECAWINFHFKIMPALMKPGPPSFHHIGKRYNIKSNAQKPMAEKFSGTSRRPNIKLNNGKVSLIRFPMPDYMDELLRTVKDRKAGKQVETTPKKTEEHYPEKLWPEATAARADDSKRPELKAAVASGGTVSGAAEQKKAPEVGMLKGGLAGQAIAEPLQPKKWEPKKPEPQKARQIREEVKAGSVTEIEREMEEQEKIEVEAYKDVRIYKVPGQPLMYYWTRLVTPTTGEKALINTIREVATRIITVAPYRIRDPEQRRNVYYQKILEIIRDSPELNIPITKQTQYADAVVREMVGYGIIDQIIKDDNLEEIMINGPKNPIYVFHRKYGMMISNLGFDTDSDIQDLINKIARQVGRRVDFSSPLLDARMPDGSRVNGTIPPASVEGSTLTIRKFRAQPYSIINLIQNGTLNAEAAAFLWMCCEGLGTRPANILISGGTGSGKTTLLNVLASFIPDTERVISIEDTAELNLPLKHWIRMEARPPGLEGTGELTLDILTKNSLRMRPDRIVVGEIRHDEAFTLFTAFNTGQDGSLGTVHANSAQETIVRVTSPPMNVPAVMMSALNFLIILHRLHDKKLGTIRRVMEIAEVTGALTGNIKTVTVYKRDADEDTLKRTGAPIEYIKLLEEMTGVTKNEIAEETIKRAEFLSRLAKEKITNMKEVSERMKAYLYRKE